MALIGFFLFTNFLLYSCHEDRFESDTELSIPEGYINFFVEDLLVGRDACEVKVVFQINRDWSMNIIYNDDKSPWCRISPSSGEAGLHKVTLQIDSNESESTRSAEVQLIVDMKKFAGIVVSQKGDSFEIDSNRVVYDDEINSTTDSVYSTLGILQCLRKVSDRYVILGEVRGDMAMINENTKTSLRNLANFNFDNDNDNEYLNVGDYYAIINNCNYALAKMDATLAINNQRVSTEEYAALQGIRAWTYLQLIINYGEVPYYTSPITSISDAEKVFAEGKKDVKFIVEDLAHHLTPYLDYELPSNDDTVGSYPILRLVLAELYLWAGDYENAVNCYQDYFMRNKKQSYEVGNTLMQSGYYSLGGNLMTIKNYDPTKNKFDVVGTAGSELYYDAVGKENLTKIEASEAMDLFGYSADNTHLSPSNSWKALSASQQLYKYEEATETKPANFYYITSNVGDLRSELYFTSAEGEEEYVYSKFMSNKINIYRRSIGYLRWAEALNALAKQRYDAEPGSPEARQLATNAFYLLKDASEVFFPQGSAIRKEFFERFEKEIRKEFIGVHARGCPDVVYDTKYYTLNLATKYGTNPSNYTFNDTISYIDNLIIDELALESTLEGNRFGDLVRFAKRREAWGDGDYRNFLATRVANRSGEANSETDDLYFKLYSSEEYWYLPFK